MKLKFNEKKHEYTIGKTKLTPVSTILDYYFGSVDMRELARKVNKNPNSKYYKRGIRKILAGWKEIRNKGSKVHKEIENYILQDIAVIEPMANQAINYLDDFAEAKGCDVLPAPEVRIYNEELGVAGTVDLLLMNTDDLKFYMFDWKTNEKIDDKEYQKMKIQVGDLKNTKLQRYQMQLSIYCYLIKVEIDEVHLVHLNEGKKPKVYILPILYKEAEYMCKNYKRDKHD